MVSEKVCSPVIARSEAISPIRNPKFAIQNFFFRLYRIRFIPFQFDPIKKGIYVLWEMCLQRLQVQSSPFRVIFLPVRRTQTGLKVTLPECQ